MKKKLLVLIIIFIVIIGIAFAIIKINDSKINYNIAEVNAYNYLQFYENGKYGVIDRDEKKVIPAEYKSVVIPNPEKDVFICYDENDKVNVFNSNGDELFTEFDKVEAIKLKNVASVLCYEKSILKYEKDGKYGIINIDGKVITKNIYDSIENLQLTEGKLLVGKNNKYGVMNIKGKVLVDINYDSVKSDGYYTEDNDYIKSGFIVSNTTNDGYKYGYINYKGKELLKTNYNEISRITDKEDIYLIVSNNGKYGLYKNSKEVIPHEYESIVYDDNDLLIIQKNKKYGVIDLKGNTKIEVKYSSIQSRGIYIYASATNENAVYDKNGNKIDINFNKSLYETENENYRISTIVNNNITYYGIENKEGITLVNESYRYLEYAYNDFFIAKDDTGNLGVINANGKVMIDLKYSLAQTIKGKNMIQVLNTKNDKMCVYSAKLNLMCEMKNANIDNEENFVKIYNKKEEKYFDNSGNEISSESETIKNYFINTLPDSIGEYTKVQYSLDSVYYQKK